MKLPAASGRGIEDVLTSALDAESIMEGKATNCILLRPNPCPLDSRFHGNDIRRGFRMPLLTPPQADEVLNRHNKVPRK